MNYLMIGKDWIMARLAERTSWDGGVVVAVSILALIASPLIKCCLLYTSPSPRD